MANVLQQALILVSIYQLLSSRKSKGSKVNWLCPVRLHAVAAAIAEENSAQNVAALEQEAKACVQPAIDWFLRKFNVQLHKTVSAFKAARYVCPVSFQWLKPTQQSVEALWIFPFVVDDGIINGLKAEIPFYLAATEDVVINTEEQKVKWWHDHKDRLPHWVVGAAILGCSRKPGVFSIIFSILIQRSTRARLGWWSASKCDDPLQQAMINF